MKEMAARKAGYVLAVFSTVLLVTAADGAGANECDPASAGAMNGRAAPYKENVYKPTPPGQVSEAYGDAPYGPDHLRRISPTEQDAAPVQILEMRPLPLDSPR